MGNAGYGNHTDDTKNYVDSKRTDSNLDSLPNNATQPGGAPKATEESGDRNAAAPEPSDRMPPAGPHADPKLVNEDATPGTGALTPPGEHDDVDAASG